MMKRYQIILSMCLLVAVFATLIALAGPLADSTIYLPVVAKQPTPTPTSTPTPTPTPTATPTPVPAATEFRGIWVTRYDWPQQSTSAKIDEIVNNIAAAGFNVIFFQVRGTADAFYNSNFEPWSARLTGTLGQNPGWDPLAYMIQKAHDRGIQVHAYINVYPVWAGCTPPPDGTTPRHLYYLIRDHHGTTAGKPNGLQWDDSGNVVCSSYQRSSPASVYVDNHLMDVAEDLVTRYDVDGLHLDHIRYAAANTSYDPVSQDAYDPTYTYNNWQRRQVNGTVWKFYDQIVPLKAGLWLSAAVWPQYIDYWGWGGQEGYHDYYQDSKAWISGGYIDSISPMIYGSDFWTQVKWETLTRDFQSSRNGRYIIPGIKSNYDDFSEIEWRINKGREIGVAGHAIFSYSSMLTRGYFDDFANGPYAVPAAVPEINWHP